MSARLTVDHGTLEGSADGLQAIAADLSRSERQQDDVAEAAGHGELGESLREFRSNWDRHRRELVEQMVTMETALRSISAGFRDADRALGAALTTEPMPPVAPSGSAEAP